MFTTVEAVVSSGTWSRRVRVARGFRQRFSGLRRAPDDAAMLFTTRSVHGFGMVRPLLAVGISQDLRVVGVKTLRPNRVVGFRNARYILEMPVGSTPPPVDGVVEINHG